MKKICLECSEEFEARRKDKRFCNDKCRQAYHASNYAMYKGTMPAEFERIKLKSRKERLKALSKMYTAMEGETCVYCGYPADCKDHLFSLAVADVLYVQCLLHKKPMPKLLLVPACTRCNSYAGSAAFSTFEDKRSYILDKIIERGEDYIASYTPPIRSKQVVMGGELETCAICKKDFLTTKGGQKFCSDECLNEYRRKSRDISRK